MESLLNTKENFLKTAHHKKVVCFGAGRILSRFLQESGDWNIDVECIIDNDTEKQGKYINYHNKEIQIQSPASLNPSEKVILITCGAVYKIKSQIRDIGIEEQVFTFPFIEPYPDNIDERKRIRLDRPAMTKLDQYCNELHLQEEQRKYWVGKIEGKLEEGIIIPYMTALITSKCTLRCQNCNNLMPYCLNAKFIAKETVIDDVNRICAAVDYCVCMNITGGEPLLHPNLDEIIDAIVANDKILFVEIITNGTLMPSPKVLQSMKNGKVIVKISEYQSYSKIRELTELFETEGIHFLVQKNLQWIVSGGIERRNKEYVRIQYEYLNCYPGKFCKSIWNGRVYACARAAFLHEIGASGHDSDYLDIDGTNLRERLVDFYLRDYIDACDFCDHGDLDNVKLVRAAVQCP